MPITATDALAVGKQTPRVYVPRIIHVAWEDVHVLIGVATHEAWKAMVKKYKTIRQVGKSAELRRAAGDLMKAWCYELILERL